MGTTTHPIRVFNQLARYAALILLFALLPDSAHGKKRALAKLKGDWILVGYHMNNGQRFIEVPTNEPSPGDTPERWRFRKDGTFVHLMDAKLGFSGTYSVIPMDIPPQQAATLRKGKSCLV